MSATGSIEAGEGIDYGAARAITLIGGSFKAGVAPGGKYPGPKSHCESVLLQFGKEPGTAHVIVPLASVDTKVPGVAGVRTSPTEKIKIRDLAITTAQLAPIKDGAENPMDPAILVHAGVVASITPNLKLDQATIIIKDHRYWLEGVSVVGSWWRNVFAPAEQNIPDVAYREGVKLHFNPNNQPNCIFAKVVDDSGQVVKIPVFCTPFFGLTDSKTSQQGSEAITTPITMIVPPASDQSTTQSCYWTVATAWQNWRWHTSKAAKAIANEGGFFPEYSTLPAVIIWPNGLENVFADNTPQSRKAFERQYHCTRLDAMLADLCLSAGPFAIDMDYNADGSNQLKIVRTRYLGADAQSGFGGTLSNSAMKGISPQRAINGNAENDMVGPTVTDAQLTISGENLYDVVAPIGEHAFIELCWATRLSDGSIEPDIAPLQLAFSEKDRDFAEDAINANYNHDNGDGTFGKNEKDYLPAVFKANDVCASYVCEPGFDFQVGTQQEGFPVAYIGRIPLPHLLSSLIPSGTSDDFARSNNRYKIAVETNASEALTGTYDDSKWLVVPDSNGLTILGDGTISFSEFRDQEAAGGNPINTFFYTIKLPDPIPPERPYRVQLIPNRVRMTLAIPTDHRICTPVSLTGQGDQTDEIPLGDIDTDDCDRINFDNGTRTLAIDTGALLAGEERSKAFPPFPIPNSFTQPDGTPYPAAGDQTDDAIALFGDALVLRDDRAFGYNQANRKMREFGRLDGGGTLNSDRIDLLAKPGDMVDTIANTDGTDFPVKRVRKSVLHDFKGSPHQTTKSTLI